MVGKKSSRGPRSRGCAPPFQLARHAIGVTDVDEVGKKTPVKELRCVSLGSITNHDMKEEIMSSTFRGDMKKGDHRARYN